MADGEPFVGVVALAVVIITWPAWYGDVIRVNPLATPKSYRLALGTVPILCLLFLLLCLKRLAARVVRENGFDIVVYLVLGAATLGISGHFFSLLGISARDDVLERRNGAALIAVIGATVGAMLCYAGGNIGEGPGMGAVILAASTAISTWFVLWYLLENLSGCSERVTVDRDLGSGLRLASLLAANGLILGVAAAGKWIPDHFVRHFSLSAWPALVLTAIAVLIERLAGPRSGFGRTLLTALAYLSVSLAWLLHRGLEA